MPSPSQDSETLTDAELAIAREELRKANHPETSVNEGHRIYATLGFHYIARLLSEVSRHRAPSVPGEDMRERARKFVAQCEGESLVEALATELLLTAALAREYERGRCWQIAFNGNGSDAADCAHNIARAIGKDG